MEDDLHTLNIKQLKALARDNGVSLDGCAEKQDIIDRLKMAGVTSSWGMNGPPGDVPGAGAGPQEGGASWENPPPGNPPPGGGGGGPGAGAGASAGAEGADGDAQTKNFQAGLQKIDADYEMKKVFPEPSNVVSGVVLGGTTIAGGIVTSAGAMVALPISGAAETGVPGFFMGIGAGILSTLVIVPVTLYQGCKQVIMGVVNTPSTTFHTIICDHYDDVDEEWVPNEWDYSLDREKERVLGAEAAAAADAAGSGGTKSVKDMTYYNLLNVDPGASDSQLKKAYYVQSRKVHPDKNPGDETAAQKFQEMSDAYQILADPVQRAKYDKHGVPNDDDKPNQTDPVRFFTMMFGADIFEPYVGKLSVVQMATLFDPDSDITSRDFKKMQRKREVELAIALVNRLEGYVEGTEAVAWTDNMEEQSKHLADAPFGEPMVHHVGYIYSNYARRYAFTIESTFGLASCAGGLHNASMKCEVTSNISNSLNVMSEQQKGKNQPQSEETKHESMNKITNAVLQTVAQVTLLDVEETVAAVCERVLTDASVTSEVRRRRCEALGILGGVFERAKSMDGQYEEGINWTAKMSEAAASSV